MEERFRENFGSENDASATERPLSEEQLPFEDLHMAEFGVSPESAVAGRTLHEIDFRRRYGVTVVAIRRGERQLRLPDGGTALFPYDKLTVVGTDEEFRTFHRVLEEQRSARRRRREQKGASALQIASFTLPARSALDGIPLGEAEVRRHGSALVLGIERPEGPVMNPSAEERLRAGDVVWAVGDPKRMKPFFNAVRRPDDDTAGVPA